MIYEHKVNNGFIRLKVQYCKPLDRKVPILIINFKAEHGQQNVVGLWLIDKNTEILPTLHRAIGHYLEHRKQEDDSENGVLACLNTYSNGVLPEGNEL